MNAGRVVAVERSSLSELPLVQYPARQPRVVARAGRLPTSEIVRVKARRAQILWALSRAWPTRDWLWRPANDVVREAWEKGIAALGSPSSDLAMGLLGEPGPRQKLTLLVPGSRWVAKVALDVSARQSIEREAANYDLLEAEGLLRGAVPKHKRAGEVLLVERLEGSHPSWASQEAARWILESLLTSDGEAIQHGDVTPWNVIRTREGYRLIDWEDASPAGRVDPLLNLLDFVIRGAAVCRATPARVNSLLGAYLPDCRADILSAYESYRQELTDGRIDGLQTRTGRYLGFLAETVKA